MLVFGLLIVPMRFTWRRKVFIFLSENTIVAKIQYGLKVRPAQLCLRTRSRFAINHITQITFIFILILFIDSLNRVYRVHLEKSVAAREGQP
jgi:hypothetical protein